MQKNLNDVNATEFYEIYKKEGGIFSPFIVMGMLKEIEKYRDINSKNTGIEKRLKQTAHDIPFTEEESMVFYQKRHVHTIIDSAKIISIIMIGGKEVSRVDLKHPYALYQKN